MIYTTDHGWAFPRAKGTLYDPGLQTSLIFYKPNEIEKGKVITDLISNVDLFPTLAEYVDKPLPPTISSTIQGRSFLSLLGLKQFSLDLEDRLNQGKATGTQGKLRDAVFSELTFHDQGYNPMRSIRTSQWKYIRNFTDCNGTLFQIPIDFINAPSGKTYIIHHNEYFTPRPPEELYDLNQDPNETKNLASNPDYSKILTEMREKLISFLVSIKDPILLGPIVERQKKSRFFY
jgi:N-sulfoglucosamine sulfohydrolase